MSTDTEKIAQLVSSLVSIVTTYESFKANTGFPVLLYNNILDLQPTAFNKMMSDISENTTSQKYSKTLDTLRAYCDMRSPLSNASSRNVTSSVIAGAITDLAVPLPPIGPSALVPEEYHKVVMKICIKVYSLMYANIREKIQQVPSASSFTLNFPNTTTDGTVISTTSLCNEIVRYIAFYANMSLPDFLTNVYTLVYDNVINTHIKDPVQRELYTACFTPYFVFIYFKNFIAEAISTPANKAPTNFIVRRAAILCVYNFLMYMIFGLYELASALAPSSKNTLLLRQILDTQITSVHNQESIDEEANSEYINLHEATRSAFDISRRITKNNRDIELTRNNLTNVAANQSKLDGPFTRAQIHYHLWLIIAIVFFILSAVIIYLKKYTWFYIACGVMYIIILLSGLIYLFKKI